MNEELSVDARLLAERLRRYVRSSHTDGALEATTEGSEASPTTEHRPDEGPSLVRSTERIDLEEVWSAVATVRSEIEGEAEPSARAFEHRRLDSAALELARAAVAQVVRANQRIVEDVSHDIRSPLNSILLLTDSLLHGHGGTLNQAQENQVRVLLTAAVALVRLVNDIMDASRIGSGREVPVDRNPFSLNELLTEARRLVSPLAVHRSVELAFDATAERRLGDRQLLCRVLINLASNAVEAAGEGGRVEVRVDESRADRLRVGVIDSGTGADIDSLRRVIAEDDEALPQYRHGWTRGLGLTIASRLVQQAAGELSVDRLEDGRTRFVVDLPFGRV